MTDGARGGKPVVDVATFGDSGSVTSMGLRAGDAGADGNVRSGDGGAFTWRARSLSACSSSKQRMRALSRSWTNAVLSSILWTAAERCPTDDARSPTPPAANPSRCACAAACAA